MKKPLAHFSIVIFAIVCLKGVANSADEATKRFESNNESLALRGIWIWKNGAGDMVLSVGVRNISQKAIKALRAKLNSVNDFGEKVQMSSIEFTGLSKYLNLERSEEEYQHLMQPNETMYYTFRTFTSLPAERFFCDGSLAVIQTAQMLAKKIDMDKAVKEAAALTLAEGNFILEVTDVAFAEPTALEFQPPVAPTTSNSKIIESSRPSIIPFRPAETGSTKIVVGEKSAVISGIPSNDTLNVRSAPSMNSKTVLTLANGVKVQIRGDSVLNGETEWVPITIDSQQGWVRSKYLQLESK
ncbi:SH3 domain-containing protein [Prosthecobacter sp.]|uniref:SH3 domain-containing protein n=1 Tax=Prosthecobacter sp. TaxID=1965333 RepID=UPI003783AB96